MRKVDSKSLRSKFSADIIRYGDLFTKAVGSLSLAEQSLMAEHTLLAAATRWVGCPSDLFIAYINREAAQARPSMMNDLKNVASTKFGPAIAAKVHFDAPKHLSRPEVVTMLDPSGRNLTYMSADAIAAGVERWLGAVYRARFARWSDEDKAAINTWIKLRHFVAHRSVKSREEMNGALANDALKRIPNFRVGARQGQGVQRGFVLEGYPNWDGTGYSLSLADGSHRPGSVEGVNEG